MRRLNMWHRLGIVLSLLWIAAGGIWQRESDLREAEQHRNGEYSVCFEALNPPIPAYSESADCMNKGEKAFWESMRGSWGNVAAFALIPVLLGWLLAYIVFWIAKWVLAGRASSN